MSKGGMEMRITNKAGGCSDGTCPAIYETDDQETVAVRGTLLTDVAALQDIGAIPGHETVVLVPRSLLEGYHGEAS